VRRPPAAVTAGRGGAVRGGAPPRGGRPAALDAGAEIPRVLAAQNYYAVLGVPLDATGGAVKRRYYALARALHPDKCRVPMGGEAMRDVAMAYTTLASPVKRALYDRYMRDVMAAGADAPRAGRSAAAPAAAAAAAADRPTPSYSEWEASQAAAVDLPPWLVCLLGVHGGGCCVATVLLLLLLPLAVVAGVATVLAWAAWVPVRAVRRWRSGAEAAAEAERRAAAKADEGWQDAMYGHV